MEIKINSSYSQGENSVLSGIMTSIDGDICHFSFVVSEDVKDMNENEKINVLLDKIYSSLFPNRAEKEAIKDLREQIEKINTESFAKIKEENKEMLSKAIADLTLLITETLIQTEEKENDNKENEGDI